MKNENINTNEWEKIEKCLSENTENGLKMAIIEANKIFEKNLKEKNPKENPEKIMSEIKNKLNNFKNLEEARRIFSKIINEADYSLEKNEAENALTAYYEATLDLEEIKLPGFFGLKKLLKNAPKINFKKIIKKIIILIVLFFVAVLFLADTDIGGTLVKNSVDLTHFFFKKIVPVVLIASALFIIIIGSVFYISNKKKPEPEEDFIKKEE